MLCLVTIYDSQFTLFPVILTAVSLRQFPPFWVTVWRRDNFMNWSQETYARAYRFAAEAHQGQKYPGTELPYLLHVGLVCMETLAALGVERERDGDLALQCALLHDTIEDTPTTYEQLRDNFGAAVADGARALSKDETLEKSAQMADSLRRIREQPPEVWMVKLADRITNLQQPPSHWKPEKIARYRQEAQQIYDALHEASPFLAARLAQKIADYQQFESKQE
jgi:(p)ppGpp synthase/HD superfamily hydrolase